MAEHKDPMLTTSDEHTQITTIRDGKDWNLPEKIFYSQRDNEGTTTR